MELKIDEKCTGDGARVEFLTAETKTKLGL